MFSNTPSASVRTATGFDHEVAGYIGCEVDEYMALDADTQASLRTDYIASIGRSAAERYAESQQGTVSAPLADVADRLQSRDEDRTRSRILNHPNWVQVPVDALPGQDQVPTVDELIEVKAWNGGWGNPDAQVYATLDPGGHAEARPLWDVRIGETEWIVFRRLSIGGAERIVAIWYYWESDLAEELPLYREDLDARAHPEQARWEKNRMYRDLLHVPVYDGEGFLLVGEEEPETAQDLLARGVDTVPVTGHGVEPERPGAVMVIAKKQWQAQSIAYFGSPDSAGEFRQSLEAIRFLTPAQQAAQARRIEPPKESGAPQARARVAPPKRLSGPQVQRATGVVRDAEPPRRGLFARIFGR